MTADIKLLAPQAEKLLGLAQGAVLKSAQLTKQGFVFIYEDEKNRTDVRLVPKIYPEGRLIIDAINDLTLTIQVKQTPLSGEGGSSEGSLELAYSTWFGEDFM